MTVRRRGEDGFTLVETLVAVAVVAVVSVALQKGFVASRLALSRAEGLFDSEAVARGILETRLGALAFAPGVQSGTTDGRAWTVTSEPLDLPLAPSSAPPSAPPAPAAAGATGQQSQAAPEKPQAVWRPLRVTVTVGAGSGPSLVIETVHLARAP